MVLSHLATGLETYPRGPETLQAQRGCSVRADHLATRRRAPRPSGKGVSGAVEAGVPRPQLCAPLPTTPAATELTALLHLCCHVAC